MAEGAERMRRICLHGPESTGKSTLGTRLAARLGCEVVPEYGRAYCEANGTNIGMAELVHIAETQDAMNLGASSRAADLGTEYVLFDTDPLITAVWAKMMFGTRDPWFDAFTGYADLYLLLDIDLPFVDDGLRVYSGADERRQFFELCRAELEDRRVPYSRISGISETRFDSALAAIGSGGSVT